MKSNRPRWLIMRAGSGIAALTLFVGALAAAPAGAAATHVRDTIAARSHTSLLPPAGVHRATPTTNYGAGFSTYPGADVIGSASVTFTVPSNVSCHSGNDTEWLAPGIWVSDDEGMLSQFSGVAFSCSSGVLTIADVMCVNTGEGSLAHCNDTLDVNPGDRVVASLSESRVRTYAAVHDLTTGGRVSVFDTSAGNDIGVFIGDVGPVYGYWGTAVVTHVPTFSNIRFSKAQVNGQYLGDWSPTRFNLATAGPVQVRAGLLTGGDTFTTTFLHN